MSQDTTPRIIIITESITASTTLLILLSPLSKDITSCSTYENGLAALQQAEDINLPFDIVFMAYPPQHHEQEDIAIQILAMSLHNNSLHHTIVMKSGQLPPEFSEEHLGENDYILTKPITREKLQDILMPMHLQLPRLNCWEYMKCGREPGGIHVADKGICPAAVDQSGNNIHGGSNAGRACWASTGTLCGGQVQGTFASKITRCQLCDFYKLVQTEEADIFESIDSILNRMRHKNNK